MNSSPDDAPPFPNNDDDKAVESARRATLRSGAPPGPPDPPDEGDGPPDPPGDGPEPPAMLDSERYTVIAIIAIGGTSIVVRALDNEILREVAIKILNPELASDASQGARFAEGARISGQLEHPNIVPVYDLGRDRGGRRFLVMKLVEGVTIEDTLSRLGGARLDPPRLGELLQVFVKACDAVAFAHSRRVLHRDLKPTNIMISEFGQVYVLDWGIARLRPPGGEELGPPVRVQRARHSQSELDPPGSLVGTMCYMPPEQLHGKHGDLDERTDVFALGATLYQILTGQPPLTGDIVGALWRRHEPPDIPPPDRLVSGGRVPPELSRIAMRALAYDPEARYQSVAALKYDIESFQRGAWDLPRMAFPTGATIVSEGEPGDAAYVILEGRCSVYHAEGTTEIERRVMGPGDVFGEMAVFSNTTRSASVRAATDVVLLKVTGDVLSKALGLNSWMGTFVKALADRFREADQRLRRHERSSWPPQAPQSTRDVASLRHAAASMPRQSVPAGTVIIAEGDAGETAYVLLEGRCVEYRAEGGLETARRELRAGDVLGETAVLSGRPSVIRVKAVTDVELVVVKRDVLSNALGLGSWMGDFVRAIAERLREAEERGGGQGPPSGGRV